MGARTFLASAAFARRSSRDFSVCLRFLRRVSGTSMDWRDGVRVIGGQWEGICAYLSGRNAKDIVSNVFEQSRRRRTSFWAPLRRILRPTPDICGLWVTMPSLIGTAGRYRGTLYSLTCADCHVQATFLRQLPQRITEVQLVFCSVLRSKAGVSCVIWCHRLYHLVANALAL